MSQQTNFLLVVGDCPEREEYLNLFQNKATCDIIESIDDLATIPKDHDFSGIVLDVRTYLRLNRADKLAFAQYLNMIPTIKLSYTNHETPGKFNVVSTIGCKCSDVSEFIDECSRREGRKIRRDSRIDIYCNVIINSDNQKSNTANVSTGGCFIFTTREYNVGDELTITTLELGDQTPIPCTIRRFIDWGNRYLAAGIGVEFLSLTEDQKKELGTLMESHLQKSKTA